MASDLEFVNYKQFVEKLPVASSYANGDKSVVSNSTNGPRQMPQTTAERIAAQNALAGNLAPEFDPTRTEENPYIPGDAVTKDGKLYIFTSKHFGSWVSGDVIQNPYSRYLLNITRMIFADKFDSLDDVPDNFVLKIDGKGTKTGFPADYPTSNSDGVLITANISGVRCQYLSARYSQFYIRKYVNDQWGEWKKLDTDSYFKSNYGYIVGDINSSGWNVEDNRFLRSAFVPSSLRVAIKPPPGYYVAKIVYYSDQLWESFVSIQLFPNDATNRLVITGNAGNFYRIVLAKIDADASADVLDIADAYYESANEAIVCRETQYTELVSSTNGKFNVNAVFGYGYFGTDGTIIENGYFLRTGPLFDSTGIFIVPPPGYYLYQAAFWNSSDFDDFIKVETFDYDPVQNFIYADWDYPTCRVVFKKINDDIISLNDGNLARFYDANSAIGNVLGLISAHLTAKIIIPPLIYGRWVSGKLSLKTGLNESASDSIRSVFYLKSTDDAAVITPPIGYYVRALVYYTREASPPTENDFVCSEFFDYDPHNIKVFAGLRGAFYRIVLSTIDGSEASTVDGDNCKVEPVKTLIGGYDRQNSAYYSDKYTRGKKLVFTGDSIPHGQVINGTAPEAPYPNIVASALGMTLVNYSIGGSTFAQSSNFGVLYESYAAFSADENKDTSKIYVVMTGNQTYQDYAYANGAWSTTSVQVRTPISARYQLMDDDADIVCVACGTNDFQYNWTPLGTMSDRTPDTFYGALHYTILGLLQKYLGKQIIFCTPIKRCQSPYTTIESVNDYNKTLEQYGQIIKEVCSYYSIPVIDLYSESGLNPHVQSQSSLFDSYKTHPYQKGHDMIARVVAGKIQSLRGSSF